MEKVPRRAIKSAREKDIGICLEATGDIKAIVTATEESVFKTPQTKINYN